MYVHWNETSCGQGFCGEVGRKQSVTPVTKGLIGGLILAWGAFSVIVLFNRAKTLSDGEDGGEFTKRSIAIAYIIALSFVKSRYSCKKTVVGPKTVEKVL